MILLEVVALAAAAAVAILRDGHSSWYLPLFFTLLTLSIVSELGALDVSGGRMKLSASFLSIVTAVVFLGETPAVLIGVATILAGWLRSRYAGHYLLVNLGIYSWFPLIAGIAFHEALDATGASRTDPLFYVLVLGAALFALAVNFTLVAGDVCYIERSRFPAVVRSALLPVLPSEVISAVLTLGIAFAYVQAGLASLALYAIVLISFQYLIGALLVSQRRGEELEHQALHDPLTGLPNRALFLDRLEQALARARRSRSGLAVMFCDLDDFKAVNDSLGHSAGDELLVALVPRLREALRAQDTVARFGGDEFVILCEDLQTVADVTNLADRIAGLFAKPLVLDGKEHFVTVSSGVVIVEGGEAEATEVLRDADAAMYRAKRRGRGGLEIFEEGMHARLLDRLRMEDELRRAISREELFLVYQPMVSLEGGVVVGAEALLRWRHPEHERGVLSPADFIESAEESGLIVPIGEWLLEEACRQAAEWQRQLDGRPFNVSVNLSARQVAHTDIAATVSDTLRKSRLDPERLDLEITERVFIGDGHEASEALRELKDLGVGLVLDDFGTGYSSLTYLKRLPIDALKIDRSFIDGLGQDEEDTAIVVAVLGIARALKMDVIAEGVETADQLAWLRDEGCRFVQGFYVSRPVRPELLTSLLRDGFPSRAIRARTNGGALPGEAVAPLEG